MRYSALLFTMFALLLGGCARTPFGVMDAKLDAMKGKPIKTATDALGDPSEIVDVGDEKSYRWSLTAGLGGAYSALAFRCDIAIFADKGGNISHYAYNGNNAGCSRYAIKLDSEYHFAKGILD